MVGQLNSDNFGNKIKLIQKLNDLDDTWIDNNIKQIIDILSLFKGLKWFIKDYLLIKNQINSSQINMLNKLIDDKYRAKNKDNFSNNIDILSPENIFDVTDHVLIKTLNYLDTQSLYNFEKTCRHGTYIARHSSSLYHLSIKWPGSREAKIPVNKSDMVRFSKIKSLQILPNYPKTYNEVLIEQFHDFINNVSTNITQVKIDTMMEKNNSFRFYHDKLIKVIMGDLCILDDTNLLKKLNQLKHFEIRYLRDIDTMTEVNKIIDQYNTKSSLKYLKIKDSESSTNNCLYKLLRVHGKTLECVSINFRHFHDIILLLTQKEMELKLDNLKQLSLTSHLTCKKPRKTAASKLMAKYWICKNIEKLYVYFDKDYMPFRLSWICNFINQCASNKSFKLLVFYIRLAPDTLKIVKKLFKNLTKTSKQTGNRVSIVMHFRYSEREANSLGAGINDIKKLINKDNNVLNWMIKVDKTLGTVIDRAMWNQIKYNDETGKETFMNKDIDDTFYFS